MVRDTSHPRPRPAVAGHTGVVTAIALPNVTVTLDREDITVSCQVTTGTTGLEVGSPVFVCRYGRKWIVLGVIGSPGGGALPVHGNEAHSPTFEPSLPTGTTSQFYRGDKTWAPFPNSSLRRTRSTAFSLPSGVWTEIPLSTVSWTQGSDLSSSGTRIRCGRAGIYLLTASARFAITSIVGNRNLDISVYDSAGTRVGGVVETGLAAYNGATVLSLASPFYLTPGLLIGMRAYQNSGSNLDIMSTDISPFLSVTALFFV